VIDAAPDAVIDAADRFGLPAPVPDAAATSELRAALQAEVRLFDARREPPAVELSGFAQRVAAAPKRPFVSSTWHSTWRARLILPIALVIVLGALVALLRAIL
jgi:hypothetical protein